MKEAGYIEIMMQERKSHAKGSMEKRMVPVHISTT